MSPYPIDRRLRRCVRSGTQNLFVVVRRCSCVVSGAGGAALEMHGRAMRINQGRYPRPVVLMSLVSLTGRPLHLPHYFLSFSLSGVVPIELWIGGRPWMAHVMARAHTPAGGGLLAREHGELCGRSLLCGFASLI